MESVKIIIKNSSFLLIPGFFFSSMIKIITEMTAQIRIELPVKEKKEKKSNINLFLGSIELRKSVIWPSNGRIWFNIVRLYYI